MPPAAQAQLALPPWMTLDAMAALDSGPCLVTDPSPGPGHAGSLRSALLEARARQCERLNDGSWRDDPMLRELSASDVEEQDAEKLVLSAPVVVEAQVMPFGTFEYPSWDGVEEFTIDKKFANKMVKNFKAYQRGGHEPFVTYGHAWNLGGTPADAWTVKLWHDGATLRQHMKLLPETAAAIAADRWRYYSATYHPEWRDEKGNEIGPTLLSGAITNFPFFTQMDSLSGGLESASTEERERWGQLLQFSRPTPVADHEETDMTKPKDRSQTTPADDPTANELTDSEKRLAELERELEAEKTARQEAEKRAASAEATVNDLGGRVEKVERERQNARLRQLVEKSMGLSPDSQGQVKASRSYLDHALPGFFENDEDAPMKALEASPIFHDIRSFESWLEAAPVLSDIALSGRSGGATASRTGSVTVQQPRVLDGGLLEPTEEWALQAGYGPGKPGHRDGETAVQHFQRYQTANRDRKARMPTSRSA